MADRLKERADKLKETDLKIAYVDELVYEQYMRLNPQTKAFIGKFGLDDRLFSEEKP